MPRLFAVLFALLAAPGARAMPVELVIGNGSFHAADAGCEAVEGGATFCTSGSWAQGGLYGSLVADLQPDGRLTSIHGSIRFDASGIPASYQAAGLGSSVFVVAGSLDLQGDGDSGAIASFLELENGIIFYFPDQRVAGGANGFDGSQLHLSGNSWDAVASQTRDDVNFALGLELDATVVGGSVSAPVPEPASLGLIAGGGLIVGAALRRPLRD